MASSLPCRHLSSQGERTVPLVRVKEKFQVTIPTDLREALHLAVGDLLEAIIEDDTLVLKPKAVVDRKQARQEVMATRDWVDPKQRPSTSL
jgi:AbrB family looped-hinge helix DNA binding protein